MYYLFVAGQALVSIFPRKTAYAIAKFLSVLHFYFSRKDRNIVAYNLSPIVKNKNDIKKYTKQVFINFAYYLADFFRPFYLSRDFIKKYVKISGLENLSSPIVKEKGGIILSAHLGNYELAGEITSFLGYPLSVVALPHKDKRLNSFFDSRRQRAGAEVIPAGISAKGCIRALRRKRLVALLGDRDFSGKGRKAKISSGHSCIIPRGPVFLALKTGAPIIPVFLVRENKYFYQLIVEEPIIFKESGPAAEQDLVEECVSVLEKYIKKYPGQWYMFEKYWI